MTAQGAHNTQHTVTECCRPQFWPGAVKLWPGAVKRGDCSHKLWPGAVTAVTSCGQALSDALCLQLCLPLISGLKNVNKPTLEAN